MAPEGSCGLNAGFPILENPDMRPWSLNSLALVAAVGLLAACGNEPAPADPPPAETPAETPADPSSETPAETAPEASEGTAAAGDEAPAGALPLVYYEINPH